VNKGSDSVIREHFRRKKLKKKGSGKNRRDKELDLAAAHTNTDMK
jgi:hypothetical protein